MWDLNLSNWKKSIKVIYIERLVGFPAPVFSLLVHLKVPHTWILRVCTFTTSAGLVLCYFAEDIVHMTSKIMAFSDTTHYYFVFKLEIKNAFSYISQFY